MGKSKAKTLKDLMKQTGDHPTEVAEALGITRRTLDRRLKKNDWTVQELITLQKLYPGLSIYELLAYLIPGYQAPVITETPAAEQEQAEDPDEPESDPYARLVLTGPGVTDVEVIRSDEDEEVQGAYFEAFEHEVLKSML